MSKKFYCMSFRSESTGVIVPKIYKKISFRFLCVLLIAVVTSVFSLALAQDRADLGADFASMVPADTLYYSGTTYDDALAELLEPMRQKMMQALVTKRAAMSDKQRQKTHEAAGEAGRLLIGLSRVYADRVIHDKPIPGLVQPAQWSIYTVGATQVIRIPLADAEAFTQFLDKAEALGSAKPIYKEYEGVTLRSYAAQKGELAEHMPNLIVAVRPHAAIITVGRIQQSGALAVALGLKAPEQPLVNDEVVHDTMVRNGFDYRHMGLINQQAIVAMLTGMANAVMDERSAKSDRWRLLANLQTPACQRDLMGLAKAWPFTMSGIQSLDEVVVENKRGIALRGRMVSRLTDTKLKQSLMQLRGHIPTPVLEGETQPIINLSLGLNMDKVAPVLMTLKQRFVQTDFQCSVLVKAQKALQRGDPVATLLPVIRALSGVRGLSVSVFSVGSKTGGNADVDAMVVISAQQPRMIFKLLKTAFDPFIGATVHLPDDGTAVAIREKRPGKPPPARAMISGKHLVVFRGDRAAQAAKHLQGDGLDANGLFYGHIEYGKLIELLAKFAPRYIANKDAVDTIKWLHEHKIGAGLTIDYLLDMGTQGVTVDTHGTWLPVDRAQGK